MTRKDYEIIAALFKRYREADQLTRQTHKPIADGERIPTAIQTAREYRTEGIAFELCTVLEKDNPQFNSKKFLKACGL